VVAEGLRASAKGAGVAEFTVGNGLLAAKTEEEKINNCAIISVQKKMGRNFFIL
jgi:hypothetical protein